MQPIISTPKTFSIWHPNSISNNPSSNPDTQPQPPPPHPPGVYSVYTAGLPRTVGGWRDILETVWSSNYYGLVRSHPPQGGHTRRLVLFILVSEADSVLLS
jgi:hypothetical protein